MDCSESSAGRPGTAGGRRQPLASGLVTHSLCQWRGDSWQLWVLLFLHPFLKVAAFTDGTEKPDCQWTQRLQYGMSISSKAPSAKRCDSCYLITGRSYFAIQGPLFGILFKYFQIGHIHMIILDLLFVMFLSNRFYFVHSTQCHWWENVVTAVFLIGI